MTKKDINYAAGDTAALKSITGANNTKRTKNTKNTESAKNTKGRPTTTESTPQPDDYRFNARFTALQGKYLQEKAFVTRTRSITAVLQKIVEEDMQRHPEIVKTIDELNG